MNEPSCYSAKQDVWAPLSQNRSIPRIRISIGVEMEKGRRKKGKEKKDEEESNE